MVFYEAAVTTLAPAQNAAAAEFQSDGTRRCYVREFGLTVEATGNAGTIYQVGRPGNTPTGGALSVGQAYDPPNATSGSGITTTWATAPTAPTVPLLQPLFADTFTQAVVYVCEPDTPLLVGPTRDRSLILFNPTGSGGVADAKSWSVRWAE